MKILICNERFLFRFGVDRVLLMLGKYWREAGHEVIMMGNKLDPLAVDKCSDRFIYVPEAADYLHSNEYAADYITEHWDEWFDEKDVPDVVLVAGWPFYKSIGLLREKCGCVFFHDYGAVPTEGMPESSIAVQNELRRLRRENLRKANKVIAISRFLEETQSQPDVEGLIETSYVHLGLDHIVENLWDQSELAIGENDVVTQIKAYQNEGYKIIFQPGRWETGNYKNSDASFDIAEKLVEKGHKIKILVLANDGDLGKIPEAVKDCYYCMGFIDDHTMRQAMELSDLGFSPTTWEGFDLPLGEMQYLDKCMYVLNIGAHPEVADHPYYLCETIDEIAEKIDKDLSGKNPYSEKELMAAHKKFRETFTWQRTADLMLEEIDALVRASRVVFIDVTNASHDTGNSGVMRVTRKISHYMQERMNTVFVLWDSSIHKYVFPYPAEVDLLCSYGGPVKDKILYRSVDGQPRKLLDEIMPQFNSSKKYHLFTETVDCGILEEATRYFHEHHVAVAAVFYDAIPVLRPELCSKAVSNNHGRYMKNLSGVDMVIPIASHNQQHLEMFWKEAEIEPAKVVSVELAAEMDQIERNTEKVSDIDMDHVNILFVSTLEPRKNHIRFLKAAGLLFEAYPELKEKVTITLIGNRYAGNTEIPEFVNAFCEDYDNVEWKGVVSDQELYKAYHDCTFTVYPSEIEGFGMPIIESMCFGKPCLCNKEGSIGELAAVGGCCLTDVMSEEAIKAALYKMVTDKAYLIALQHEAAEREIKTWNQYVDDICDVLMHMHVDFTKYERSRLRLENKLFLKEWLKKREGSTIITVGNFYPPDFCGGAEIIAHNQGMTMAREKIVNVMAVTVAVKENRIPGDNDIEMVDSIPVLRICVSGENFDASGINFFDRKVNEVFDEVCELIRPKAVHCHNIIGTSLGIVDAAHKWGAKVVATLHDNWGFCFKNTCLDNKGELCADVFNCEACMPRLTGGGISLPIDARRSYFRRIFEKIDAYISPSRYLAMAYIRAGVDAHKMHVIWNGIDVEKYDKLVKKPSDKLRITFVGYFGVHKGIADLIKAVGKIKDERIQINLVGSGDEQNNYRQIAAEHGVLNQIKFWGKIPNEEVIDVYAETDIYCLPSIWPENQPVSITEAMACGIPVIASAMGGNKELVKDGVTGRIFKAADVDALAECISGYLNDPQSIKDMGAAGKSVMNDNSFKQQVKKIAALYNEEAAYQIESSRGILAVKGMRWPDGVSHCTSLDTLCLDWIQTKEEMAQIRACLILPGEKLTEKEIYGIEKYQIPLIIEHRFKDKYKKIKTDVYTYLSSEELYELLAFGMKDMHGISEADQEKR